MDIHNSRYTINEHKLLCNWRYVILGLYILVGSWGVDPLKEREYLRYMVSWGVDPLKEREYLRYVGSWGVDPLKRMFKLDQVEN